MSRSLYFRLKLGLGGKHKNKRKWCHMAYEFVGTISNRVWCKEFLACFRLKPRYLSCSVNWLGCCTWTPLPATLCWLTAGWWPFLLPRWQRPDAIWGCGIRTVVHKYFRERRIIKIKPNVELAFLPCWQLALLKGEDGCTSLEASLQYLLQPFLTFCPLRGLPQAWGQEVVFCFSVISLLVIGFILEASTPISL